MSYIRRRMIELVAGPLRSPLVFRRCGVHSRCFWGYLGCARLWWHVGQPGSSWRPRRRFVPCTALQPPTRSCTRPVGSWLAGIGRCNDGVSLRCDSQYWHAPSATRRTRKAVRGAASLRAGRSNRTANAGFPFCSSGMGRLFKPYSIFSIRRFNSCRLKKVRRCKRAVIQRCTSSTLNSTITTSRAAFREEPG